MTNKKPNTEEEPNVSTKPKLERKVRTKKEAAEWRIEKHKELLDLAARQKREREEKKK